MDTTMSTCKAYPWQQISDDTLGTRSTSEADVLQLDTSICKGFLTGGLQAVTPAGIPIPAPVKLSDLSRAYVTEDNANNWLQSEGFSLTWAAPEPKTDPDKGPSQIEKRWDNETIQEMIEYEKNLKSSGVKNYAQQTADHYDVDASRIRQVKRRFNKRTKLTKNTEAFSSTYPK
jgi:hypothetical protein